MRLLFVHQHFPGQFLHVVRHLAQQARHEIVFISEQNADHLPGVERRTYRLPAASLRTHFDARDFDVAMRRAEAVARLAWALRREGFTPDIVLGHEAWGGVLNSRTSGLAASGWDTANFFITRPARTPVGNPEFPTPPGMAARIRAKNAALLLSLHSGDPGVSPTRWQRSLFPGWAQPAISVIPDGVDLAVCRPDPAARQRMFQLGDPALPPGRKLVTFVARDLEPYRGFHTLVRSLPALLDARPDVSVICLGGDGVSYGTPPPNGTWRDRLLAEVPIDRTRVHFPGLVPYTDHVRLLQRSDVHAYLSYPFVASWSLREALACGCTVVAADTPAVAEFGGLSRVPPLDPAAVADRVLSLLDDPAGSGKLATEARRFAEAELGAERHVAAYTRLIASIAGMA